MATDEVIERPELREYRLRARDWLAANMTRLARRPDGTVELPDDSEPRPDRVARARDLQAKIYEAGYAGFAFPVEYGGQGLTYDHERVFLEESGGYDMPTQVFAVSINILGATLAAFASHEQKQQHLRNILSGKEIWLQFLSEPSGGSDLAGLITRADRDGDSYVINGQKIWSTGAMHSDFAICPTRTNWDVPKHKGITVFILDLKSPGVDIRPIKQINGGAEFCEEFLTDVVVPAANIVGAENEGWNVARGLLEIEHSWQGRSSGGGRRQSRNVRDLVSLAERKGLSSDPGVRRSIAEIYTLGRLQSLASVRVSNAMVAGKLNHGHGGLLKLGNDIVLQKRTELGMRLAGSIGAAWEEGSYDSEWSQDYLTSRGMSIAGGSDEIQRNNVSERALGLPREPAFDRDIPFNQVPRN